MNINLVIPLSEKLNDKLSDYYYQKFSDSTNKNYLEKAIVSGLVITKSLNNTSALLLGIIENVFSVTINILGSMLSKNCAKELPRTFKDLKDGCRYIPRTLIKEFLSILNCGIILCKNEKLPDFLDDF
jgi:hypothetical protein